MVLHFKDTHQNTEYMWRINLNNLCIPRNNNIHIIWRNSSFLLWISIHYHSALRCNICILLIFILLLLKTETTSHPICLLPCRCCWKARPRLLSHQRRCARPRSSPLQRQHPQPVRRIHLRLADYSEIFFHSHSYTYLHFIKKYNTSIRTKLCVRLNHAGCKSSKSSIILKIRVGSNNWPF